MLSSHAEPETVRLALARGAAAYVCKAETPEKIIAAIDQALLGEMAALPGAAGEAGATGSAGAAGSTAVSGATASGAPILTPRQRGLVR